MKVAKRVNAEGCIKIEITDVPAMPNEPNCRYNYSGTANAPDTNGEIKKRSRVQSIRIGDLFIDFSACSDFTDYDLSYSAEMIAKALQNRFDYAWKKWSEFLKKHTESIEVTDRDRFVAECDANHRLLYRGKNGKFHEIK